MKAVKVQRWQVKAWVPCSETSAVPVHITEDMTPEIKNNELKMTERLLT